MKRNVRVLGIVVAAIFILATLGAQGVQADVSHEFHADSDRVVATGVYQGSYELTIGTKGIVKCKKVTTESTWEGVFVGSGTYASDTITVKQHPSECEFGGAAATVNSEHCATVLDSDTTAGSPTGGEHANLEVECVVNNSIKIATSTCTLTVGPQLVKHAVRYVNDPINKNAIEVVTTGHETEIGNLNDKAGCVLFPKGKVGKFTGTATMTCFRDDGGTLGATEQTTPTGLTVEGPETECKISNL